MIKKILVPLDGSRNSYRGLDEAINLARQCKAIIIGIHIKDMPGIYALHPIGFIGFALGKEGKKVIENAKQKCAKKGILFHGKILGGDPPSDIIAFAHNKRNRINVIVIGARGRGTLKGIFLGSVSNYVIHKSKIPVLVVK
jgi:nucleotide-binding universal stress UspA family protein